MRPFQRWERWVQKGTFWARLSPWNSRIWMAGASGVGMLPTEVAVHIKTVASSTGALQRQNICMSPKLSFLEQSLTSRQKSASLVAVWPGLKGKGLKIALWDFEQTKAMLGLK